MPWGKSRKRSMDVADDGWSPISWAARCIEDEDTVGIKSEDCDFSKTIKLLIDNGADTSVRRTIYDKNFEAHEVGPWELAQRTGHSPEVLELLKPSSSSGSGTEVPKQPSGDLSSSPGIRSAAKSEANPNSTKLHRPKLGRWKSGMEDCQICYAVSVMLSSPSDTGQNSSCY